jgi:membrane protease YdiL (CAAX protease family)
LKLLARDRSGIPLAYALPGLVLIFVMEILVLLGIVQFDSTLQLIFTALMVIAPWFSLLLSRRKVEAFAFRKDRFLLHLGWGMVAGGLWRLGDILLNLWSLQLGGFLETASDVFTIVIWVPFIEETFFRAYIGRSIGRSWGAIPAIVIQAIVFTLLPTHIAQGIGHMISIFAFGILAGWLMQARRSIWAPWGAHAFANLLPLLTPAIY